MIPWPPFERILSCAFHIRIVSLLLRIRTTRMSSLPQPRITSIIIWTTIPQFLKGFIPLTVEIATTKGERELRFFVALFPQQRMSKIPSSANIVWVSAFQPVYGLYITTFWTAISVTRRTLLPTSDTVTRRYSHRYCPPYPSPFRIHTSEDRVVPYRHILSLRVRFAEYVWSDLEVVVNSAEQPFR